MLVSIHKLKFILVLLIMVVAIKPIKAQVWTLQQCIDTAQAHSISLQISRNDIEITEQKQKEARANLLPKINANSNYKYFTNLPYQFMPMAAFGGLEGEFKEVQFGVPHNIDANVHLAVPLFNPQIKGAVETTKIASELRALQYQKTEEDPEKK